MPYVNIKITKEGNVTPEQKFREEILYHALCKHQDYKRR